MANRPNTAYTQIAYFVATGHRDQTQVSMALNRRFKNNFQSGVTYTYMVSMHDDGNIGYTAPGQNNQFDYLTGEYANSTDLPGSHAAPLDAVSLPARDLRERVVLLRIGPAIRREHLRRPYGKPGTNRLNLTAAGGATNAIVIPTTATLANGDVIDIASRFEGRRRSRPARRFRATRWSACRCTRWICA